MIVALLSWFDERPAWLRETIESLALLGVDHLVAVDGAYHHFPGARPRSTRKERQAIARAARVAGVGLTIHQPDEVWPSEIVKRTAMFRLAEQVADPGSWYFVIDADEIVQSGSLDALEETNLDAAEATISEPHPDGAVSRYPLRMFFRAILGLEVVRNHYTYRTPDGRVLWGRGRCEPALSLDVQVEHRTHQRHRVRREVAQRYYRLRDDLRLEVGQCEHCGAEGVEELPTDYRAHPKGLTSTWVSVCANCEPKVREENNRVIRSHGLDPETIQVTFEKAAA